MGSTGEPDRKRRHFSSISSPTAAMAKKQPLSHLSEDKKVWTFSQFDCFFFFNGFEESCAGSVLFYEYDGLDALGLSGYQ